MALDGEENGGGVEICDFAAGGGEVEVGDGDGLLCGGGGGGSGGELAERGEDVVVRLELLAEVLRVARGGRGAGLFRRGGGGGGVGSPAALLIGHWWWLLGFSEVITD